MCSCTSKEPCQEHSLCYVQCLCTTRSSYISATRRTHRCTTKRVGLYSFFVRWHRWYTTLCWRSWGCSTMLFRACQNRSSQSQRFSFATVRSQRNSQERARFLLGLCRMKMESVAMEFAILGRNVSLFKSVPEITPFQCTQILLKMWSGMIAGSLRRSKSGQPLRVDQPLSPPAQEMAKRNDGFTRALVSFSSKLLVRRQLWKH